MIAKAFVEGNLGVGFACGCCLGLRVVCREELDTGIDVYTESFFVSQCDKHQHLREIDGNLVLTSLVHSLTVPNIIDALQKDYHEAPVSIEDLLEE